MGRFHVGTGQKDSLTPDTSVPTMGNDCMRFITAKTIEFVSCYWGESIYEGLGPDLTWYAECTKSFDQFNCLRSNSPRTCCLYAASMGIEVFNTIDPAHPVPP